MRSVVFVVFLCFSHFESVDSSFEYCWLFDFDEKHCFPCKILYEIFTTQTTGSMQPVALFILREITGESVWEQKMTGELLHYTHTHEHTHTVCSHSTQHHSISHITQHQHQHQMMFGWTEEEQDIDSYEGLDVILKLNFIFEDRHTYERMDGCTDLTIIMTKDTIPLCRSG